MLLMILGFIFIIFQWFLYIDNEYIGVMGEINLIIDLGDLVILLVYCEVDIDLVFVSFGFQVVENNEYYE